MKHIHSFFVVQEFLDEAWRSLYAATFQEDSEVMLKELTHLTNNPIRLVEFVTSENMDFIATAARDFRVLDKINPPRLRGA